MSWGERSCKHYGNCIRPGGATMATCFTTCSYYHHKDALTESEKELLRKLMPEWALNSVSGLSPEFYGTGSYTGDNEVIEMVKRILF